MAGDSTLTYTDPGAGGFIDLQQFGIKPERDQYYARVNPKTGCWECIPIPDDCRIPTQGKTAHLKYDAVAHARPIMCVPDRIACGCGCGCAKCEPTAPDNGDPMPCLRVTKSCDPAGPYKEGDQVVFAFVVENCGNTDIMGIQLADDMTTVEGGPIDLAPGAIDETTFTAMVEVTADMIPDGFTNNVTATGSVPESSGGGTIDATDSHTVTTEGGGGTGALELVKDCASPGPYMEGDDIVYTFTVTNTGTEDITGVVVTDSLGVVSGGPIDLAAGASDSTTFTMTYTVDAMTPVGDLVNTATATGVGADSGDTLNATDDHTATIAGDGPAISLVKSCDPAGPYQPGETVNFTFEVTNPGTVDLTGVVVTDPMLDAVSGGPIDLAAGATDSTTFTGSYVIPDGTADGDITNTATVTADEVDGVTATAEASHTFNVSSDTTCDDAECTATATSVAASIVEPGSPANFRVNKVGCGLFGTGLFGSTGSNSLSDISANGNIANIPVPAHDADCVLFLHIMGGQVETSGLPVLAGVSGGADVAPAQYSLIDIANGGGSVGGTSAPNGDIYQAVYVMDGTGTGVGSVDIELPDLDPFNASDLLMYEWAEVCAETCKPLRVTHLKAAPIYEGSGETIVDDDQFVSAIMAEGYTTACHALQFTSARHAGGFSPASVGGVKTGPGSVNYDGWPTIVYTMPGHPFAVGDTLDVCTTFGDAIQNTITVTAVIDADTFETDIGGGGGFEGWLKTSGDYTPVTVGETGCIAADWSGVDDPAAGADPSQEIYDDISTVTSECQGGLGLHYLDDTQAGAHNWWYQYNVPAANNGGWSDSALVMVAEFDTCDPIEETKTDPVTATKATNFCTYPAAVTCAATFDIGHAIPDGESVEIVPVWNGTADAAGAVTLTGTGPTTVTLTAPAMTQDAAGEASCELVLCIKPTSCSTVDVPAFDLVLTAAPA